MTNEANLRAVAQEFEINGEFRAGAPHGRGLIHRSYCVTVGLGPTESRYILQRLNTQVFTRPIELMENVKRVTAHLSRLHERALTLVHARNGRSFHVDAEGATWRIFNFIERTRSVEQPQCAEQCYEAARAFGEFQQRLITLPPPRLHDTIPGFHDTPQRIAALERAIEADVAGRVSRAQAEIGFVMSRKPLAQTLLNANLPERIVHNDTKIDNVLVDEVTGKAVCVIDLDTVMPGLAPYDFGDMVRTAACTAAEDELDLDKVYARFDYYEALVEGYLSSAGGFLTARERELLAASGKLITYEQGVRFLWDYLRGDAYYPVTREEHNLDRCRTQFRLLESIEQQEHRMSRLGYAPNA